MPLDMEKSRLDLVLFSYWFFAFSWSGRHDSNVRPLAPHASALARLRYAPTEQISEKPNRCILENQGAPD
jgi:hypothetical protein